MNLTTIIIAVASVGFILMGIFIMNSKTISKHMVSSKDSQRGIRFIKQNGYINISIGVIGIIIAFLDYILKEGNIFLIIIFISLIFLSSLLQGYLGKKFRI